MKREILVRMEFLSAKIEKALSMYLVSLFIMIIKNEFSC